MHSHLCGKGCTATLYLLHPRRFFLSSMRSIASRHLPSKQLCIFWTDSSLEYLHKDRLVVFAEQTTRLPSTTKLFEKGNITLITATTKK